MNGQIYDVVFKVFKEIALFRLMVFNSGHIRRIWGIKKKYCHLGPPQKL